MAAIETLGDLRQSGYRSRPVKQEIRDNLVCKLRAGETLFPGIIGYDETVIPQLVNAVLSRHNFILLGLRGQAKSRILRGMVDLLDEKIPIVPGCEIHDDPLAPLCAACRARVAAEGDRLRIGWLHRDDRYVEKLATPDVTIADMVGDIDPIKAAGAGLNLSDELTMHYGLLPRANRGIFAVNELPDLAGKIQVGLFNILQEGDVQIKGYPIRLKLDVMLVFTANPEDYTARGKIITPLKDRIGSEIRTHYPSTRGHAMAITKQEAWTERAGAMKVEIPDYVREVVEEIAFQARSDRKVDKRSGVSQRLPISTLELVLSNAERRALANGENVVVPRVTDVYAALAVDHRQVRARVRGRAARRGADRARPDSLGRRLGLHRHLRRHRHPHRRRMVRSRRLAAAQRQHLRRRGDSADPRSAGAARACRSRRPGAGRHRAGGRIRRRSRSRRALRAEKDQPQRGARLRRSRIGPAPHSAAR
jgi:magnesium chelatase subunit I